MLDMVVEIFLRFREIDIGAAVCNEVYRIQCPYPLISLN